MDYLEQIRAEFPEVELHSGDLEWGNQAFGALKEKNYEKAEILFKKMCLSDPEHHDGFEGLAYVYYMKGEFEKAGWFMGEALKLAKQFIEQDAIDPEVIEEMETSWQSLQGEEPLETTWGTFHPGEGAHLFSSDLELWFDNLHAALPERRFQMVMEAIEQPLPLSLQEQSGVKEAEGPADQERLEEFLFEYATGLFENKELDKCRQLLENMRTRHPGLYRKYFNYFDKRLIQLALFHGEGERVRDYLDFFVEDPVSGIDELIVVLQLLQFHRRCDLAEELSRSVSVAINESEEIIPGGEIYFEDTLFAGTLERVYRRLQKGESPRIEEVNASLKDYQMHVDEELFEDILYHLSPGDDRQKTRALLENDSEWSMQRTHSLLFRHFNKYMLEEKGMEFVLSSEIYSWLMNCYKGHTEAGEPGEASLEELFAFPREALRDFVGELGGLLSNQWPRTAALIWGAPYLYEFLSHYGLVSETCRQEALEGITALKEEFKEGYRRGLWEFSFVHEWPRPEDVKEEDWQNEKEMFRQTAYEVPESPKESFGPGGRSSATDKLFSELLKPEPKKIEKERQQQKDQKKKKSKKKEAKKQRQKQRKKK